MKEIYNKIKIPLFTAVIIILLAKILRDHFQIPSDYISLIVVYFMVFLNFSYVIFYGDKFSGPSGDLALMTFLSTSVALVIAGVALFDSSRDSMVLQAQLTELKKITAILESKE